MMKVVSGHGTKPAATAKNGLLARSCGVMTSQGRHKKKRADADDQRRTRCLQGGCAARTGKGALNHHKSCQDQDHGHADMGQNKQSA